MTWDSWMGMECTRATANLFTDRQGDEVNSRERVAKVFDGFRDRSLRQQGVKSTLKDLLRQSLRSCQFG